ECEGGPDNRHRGADQWLFVVAGGGLAVVNGKRHVLRAGSLVLIEKGDTHEIRNTERTLLETLNLYVRPAYRSEGEELPRGRRLRQRRLHDVQWPYCVRRRRAGPRRRDLRSGLRTELQRDLVRGRAASARLAQLGAQTSGR